MRHDISEAKLTSTLLAIGGTGRKTEIKTITERSSRKPEAFIVFDSGMTINCTPLKPESAEQNLADTIVSTYCKSTMRRLKAMLKLIYSPLEKRKEDPFAASIKATASAYRISLHGLLEEKHSIYADAASTLGQNRCFYIAKRHPIRKIIPPTCRSSNLKSKEEFTANILCRILESFDRAQKSIKHTIEIKLSERLLPFFLEQWNSVLKSSSASSLCVHDAGSRTQLLAQYC